MNNSVQEIPTTDTQSKSFTIQRLMLSAEGLTIFSSSLVAYGFLGGNWWLFALLLLSPDLVFVIYMMNKTIGTHAYNVVHSYVLPVILGVTSLVIGWQLGLTLALIWTSHIGMDRTVGYGLKYITAFKDTHLQRV